MNGLLAEPLLVFRREEKCLDHLRVLKVPAELVELREPELPAREVSVIAGVGVAAEVAEVLHQHERAVEFLPLYSRVLGHGPRHLRAFSLWKKGRSQARPTVTVESRR